MCMMAYDGQPEKKRSRPELGLNMNAFVGRLVRAIICPRWDLAPGGQIGTPICFDGGRRDRRCLIAQARCYIDAFTDSPYLRFIFYIMVWSYVVMKSYTVCFMSLSSICHYCLI